MRPGGVPLGNEREKDQRGSTLNVFPENPVDYTLKCMLCVGLCELNMFYNNNVFNLLAF